MNETTSPEKILSNISIAEKERSKYNLKTAIFAGITAFNGVVASTEDGNFQKVVIFAAALTGCVTVINIAESSRQSRIIEAYENLLDTNNSRELKIYDYESEISE